MLVWSLLVALFSFSWPACAEIDLATLSAFQRISGYAGSAYCPQNYGFPANRPGTFPPNPFNLANSTEIVYSFLNVGESETAGLIMLDHAHRAIIITFRGTVSDEDWDTNLDFFRSNANSLCGKDCKIHGGFFDSWSGVSDLVVDNWLDLRDLYPGYSSIVTGHSLGGALAHVCAAALKKTAPDADLSLYTFASPRVGNEVFAAYMNKNFGANNYRVTHLNDPVPRLPGRLLGFAHTSPEYHIVSPHIKNVLSASKKTLANPANDVVLPKDVLVFPGPESEKGNAGYSCTNVAMHDEYFINIADCVVDDGTPLLQSTLVDILSWLVIELTCV